MDKKYRINKNKMDNTGIFSNLHKNNGGNIAKTAKASAQIAALPAGKTEKTRKNGLAAARGKEKG